MENEEAVKQEDVELATEEPAEGAAAPQDEGESGEGQPDGDGQPDPEVDIILEGDETQPQSDDVPKRSFLKRINKLNGKVDKAKGEAEAERKRAADLEEENRILRMTLDSQSGSREEPTKQPDPNDFDGGAYDPEYIQKSTAYAQEQAIAAARTELAESQKKAQEDQRKAQFQEQLRAGQKEHFLRASKLKVPDYEEVEDKAIEILGIENANQIMLSVPKSEVLLYYLGKNPDKAEYFADAIQKNAVKALVEIGGLIDKIKVKPKNEPPPEPDTELEGAAPTGNEALHKKYEKLLDEAGKTGKMQKVIDFKRELKEKGITLQDR